MLVKLRCLIKQYQTCYASVSSNYDAEEHHSDISGVIKKKGRSADKHEFAAHVTRTGLAAAEDKGLL